MSVCVCVCTCALARVCVRVCERADKHNTRVRVNLIHFIAWGERERERERG